MTETWHSGEKIDMNINKFNGLDNGVESRCSAEKMAPETMPFRLAFPFLASVAKSLCERDVRAVSFLSHTHTHF